MGRGEEGEEERSGAEEEGKLWPENRGVLDSTMHVWPRRSMFLFLLCLIHHLFFFPTFGAHLFFFLSYVTSLPKLTDQQ